MFSWHGRMGHLGEIFIISSGNKMMLEFTSDSAVSKQGFEILAEGLQKFLKKFRKRVFPFSSIWTRSVNLPNS